MGFWIFMFLSSLLIPLMMIGFGRYFLKGSPREINAFFGYRTSMSSKNRDTWEFAHRYFGRLWYIGGLVLVPVTVLPMLLAIGKGEGDLAALEGILIGIQMVPLIGSIPPTELALRKNFDRNGNRR